MTDNLQNEEVVQPPPILYHYTTVAGLKGIIENKNIWATNVNFLNDRREYRELVEQFLKILEDNPEFEQLQDLTQRMFDEWSRGVYVCSFSASEDDLSQWRAYGSGGTGYCIGFNSSELQSLLFPEPPRALFYLARCKYGTLDQQTEIGATFQKQTELVRERPHSNHILEIVRNILTAAARHKNDAFEDEAEWRIVKFVSDYERIHFREGKGVLIPYQEIDLTDKEGGMPITSIWIGPTSLPQESTLSLRLLLQQNGVADVTIEQSKVPYRTL
jgi:hypothetical protein